MEMPKVLECMVSDCAYNSDQKCHAMAITVGDEVHPTCDTFCRAETMGGDTSYNAGVGACKVAPCLHNKDLECQAQEISVGYKEGEVDCLTFCPK